jgi:C1A family cysteine protease
MSFYSVQNPSNFKVIDPFAQLAQRVAQLEEQLTLPSRPFNLKPHKCEDCDLNYISFTAPSKAPAKLPTKIDLRSKMPPVIDQGSLGSCTACALAGVFGFLDPKFEASPLFIYYNERFMDSQQGGNSPVIDDGSTLRQGVKSLVSYGACSEQVWPYIENMFATRPNTGAYTEALDHQAIQFKNVKQTLVEMKTALNNGFPFVFGFLVYQSFVSSTVTRSGVVPMPKSRERILGGHAVVCVGYDDTKQLFTCRNSWGTDWGDNGHFYLPYSYLTNGRLASDLWVIQSVEKVS